MHKFCDNTKVDNDLSMKIVTEIFMSLSRLTINLCLIFFYKVI